MDNNYPDSMPRMSDGRNFTSYIANASLNISGQKTSSNSYRMDLTHNASRTMAKAAEKATRSCVDTQLAEQSKKTCNTSHCTVQNKETRGLGQGRGAA